MIIPTVGRIVLFHPAAGNPGPAVGTTSPKSDVKPALNQPLAAIITYARLAVRRQSGRV